MVAIQAMLTYNHQTIFDPILREVLYSILIFNLFHHFFVMQTKPLQPFILTAVSADNLTSSDSLSDAPPTDAPSLPDKLLTLGLNLEFLGPQLPRDISCGIADGFLDPMTHVRRMFYNNYVNRRIDS